jgi:hypothetical protein
MWIPYFIFEFWETESPPETIAASENDTEERRFEIGFFLENPPSRNRGVEIELEQPEQRAQTDGMGRQAAILFQPNNNNLLNVIVYQLNDSNPKEAFKRCFDNLSQLLSFWALGSGSGFSIYSVRIQDLRHNAVWIIKPQSARPAAFFIPREINIGPEHAAMLSLYREARNTQSPFYRFLCCYKILEGWYNHGSIFGMADRLIRERNLTLRRPRRTITREMLVMSLLFNTHPEFEGRSFANFFQLLNPWRVKIAHFLTEAGEYINFDSYESQLEFGPIANLTDMAARDVLSDEFHLWGQIREAEQR